MWDVGAVGVWSPIQRGDKGGSSHSSDRREHIDTAILRLGVLLDSPPAAVLFASALEHVHVLRAALVRRVCTASRCESQCEVAFAVIGHIAGATIDDSFLLAVVVDSLEAAVEHSGGTMAAKTATGARRQVRQATQLVGGRPRQAPYGYACVENRVFRSGMYQNSGLLLSHTVILGVGCSRDVPRSLLEMV